MRDARKIARDVASCVRSSTGDNVVVAVLAQAEAAIIIEAAQAEAKAEGRAEAVEEVAQCVAIMWLAQDQSQDVADSIRRQFGGKS